MNLLIKLKKRGGNNVKKTKRILCSILSVVMMLGLLAGCGKSSTSSSSSTPTKGGKLTIGLNQVPKNLDPIKYTGTYESDVMAAIFDTLVTYDKNLKNIVPSIATKWTVSSDMTEYTFDLRNDVYFQKGKYQNGRKMTAEDVKYSIERSAKQSAMKRLRDVQSVTVTGNNQVKVKLDKPNATFLVQLTDEGNAIVPKEEVEGWGDQFGQHPVGTGAFSFSSWAKDDNITLKKNDKHFGTKANIDTLVWKFIPDDTMMVNAIKTGEIDIATTVPGAQRNSIKSNKDLSLVSTPGLDVYFTAMNMQNGPTKDIKVRQAISYAVNVDQIVKSIFKWGGASRAYSPVPPKSWGYDSNMKNLTVKQNLTKAKELMKEAGYPNGFKATIVTPQDPNRIKMATILQTQLKEIGIDLQISSMEWGSFSDTVSKGKADFYTLAWSWYPDPDFFLYQMFSSNQIGTLGNGQGYKNDQVDKLLDEATQKTVNQSQRAETYKKIQEIIAKDYPRIEGWNQDEDNAVRNRVHGYYVYPDGLIRVVSPGENVWVSK